MRLWRARCWTASAQGADAVRTIVGTIRTLYERQEFNFTGPYGDDGWVEDYANYRPRSSLLLLSRLVGEKLVGSSYAKYFLTSEP
jgi:hypothetical protein